MKTKIAFLLLPMALALGACMDTTEDRTLLGTTAAGATAGALLNKKNPGTGAIVGGAVGAVAGSVINENRRGNNGQCLYRDRYGREYYAPC
ncbi:YmgG-like glycine-zipper protein [Rhodobacter sp. 140A]|uniref:YMGG-like Gly-zipper domain-containing protein n=1 Tax=bioreactor metagenome TaxID=1076179 RepID=A0A644XME5_9ZZZZ|nr:YmgG-like glycine-zipper protein [Rhodobacter sp. 140A]